MFELAAGRVSLDTEHSKQGASVDLQAKELHVGGQSGDYLTEVEVQIPVKHCLRYEELTKYVHHVSRLACGIEYMTCAVKALHGLCSQSSVCTVHIGM